MASPNGHKVLITLAAITCGMAIAACGSVKSSTTAAALGQFAQGVMYSDCMRSHGVSNFPDPVPGGGFNIRGLGAEAVSPAFVSAQNACVKYLPRDGTEPPLTPPWVVRDELRLATCMRANGVPGFPDPNAQGNIQFPINSPIPQSPAFQRAQSGPCKKYSDALGP